ncbi:MAG: twin-arginine translocase subunit TatC [Cytophagales bacterium]|nr:twin-arginine translocase subunit TatC [Cytophagales bacterium]
MSFVDHLEELRWHIIRPVISIVVFSIAAFFLKDFVFGVLILGPAKPDFWTYRMLCLLADVVHYPDLCVKELNFTLQSRQMAGQFSMHLTSAFTVGFICAFPYAFWEIWRFIAPGLYPKERNAARGAVFFVTILFVMGVLFGYYIVSPLMINFLANYQLDPAILNQFDITSYVSTLVMMVLACGLMFQLPIILLMLAKAGLVGPAFLREYRKHAIVVILVIAALITPSPDVLSQILVAMPLIILYEISIFLVAWEVKKQIKELQTVPTTTIDQP